MKQVWQARPGYSPRSSSDPKERVKVCVCVCRVGLNVLYKLMSANHIIFGINNLSDPLTLGFKSMALDCSGYGKRRRWGTGGEEGR